MEKDDTVVHTYVVVAGERRWSEGGSECSDRLFTFASS